MKIEQLLAAPGCCCIHKNYDFVWLLAGAASSIPIFLPAAVRRVAVRPQAGSFTPVVPLDFLSYRGTRAHPLGQSSAVYSYVAGMGQKLGVY